MMSHQIDFSGAATIINLKMETGGSEISLDLISQSDIFKCGKCHFEINDLLLFLEHKKDCHAFFEQEEDQELTSSEEPIKLKVIETPLNSEPVVIDHLTCQICLKKFKKGYNLKQHLLIHSDQKPFQCPICGKAFVQKANLVKHLTVHSKDVKDELRVSDTVSFEILTKKGRKMAVLPQKVSRCQSCSFSTNSLKQLRAHQVIEHAKKPPLKCLVCDSNDEVFESQVELSAHFDLKHQDEEKALFQQISVSIYYKKMLNKKFKLFCISANQRWICPL